MGSQSLAIILIVTGFVIAGLGLILYFSGAWPFSYFGRLPGDIRIEHGNFRFYFPIVTSILLSLLLTLLIYIVSRFR